MWRVRVSSGAQSESIHIHVGLRLFYSHIRRSLLLAQPVLLVLCPELCQRVVEYLDPKVHLHLTAILVLVLGVLFEAKVSAGDIIIPANSQILEIQITVTTAPEAGNISVGTSATSTELFTGVAAGTAANVFLFGSAGTITDGDAWADIGGAALPIFADCSAGTTGRGFLTVSYIQGIDNA